MVIKTKNDLLVLLKNENIESGYLGNFKLLIDSENINEIINELGIHTAYKLSHDNVAISDGFTHYGVINYDLSVCENYLTGKCLQISTKGMKDLFYY